ncbi:MAG: hypothetical protein H0U29_05345, partial [Acidimicrobiia bacterium]|nr:hypothetical protein [Acidimicrobiia bacterium]
LARPREDSVVAGAPAGVRIAEITVAGEPAEWRRAGFHVDGDLMPARGATLRLAGATSGRRITGWTLRGRVAAELDGLPTSVTTDPAQAPSPPVHPNGVLGVDHVVAFSPDLDRTVAALEAAGLDLRRVREGPTPAGAMRQAFFRLGDTIVEAVSGDAGTGLGADVAPATWFGLALDVTDLDATGALLGDGLGAVKEAVQEGRRIATLRHRMFAMSVAVAAMDDHADR